VATPDKYLKNKINNMKTYVNRLTPNEVEFMRYWTGVLKHKARITSGELDYAANLISHPRTGNCSTCLRTDAVNMNNTFRQLLPTYNQYLDDEKTLELIDEAELKREKKQDPTGPVLVLEVHPIKPEVKMVEKKPVPKKPIIKK